MANFTINGKEHELKLTYTGVKYLNGVVGGNALEVVGQAIQGDLDIFPHVISAALKHTGENHTISDVEQAIEQAVEEERLDFRGIMQLSNEVIAESFFYRAIMTKMMTENKDAKKALDKLLK